MKKLVNSILKTTFRLINAGFVFVFLFVSSVCFGQSKITVLKTFKSVKPLENVEIVCSSKGILIVKDSKNREYFRTTPTNHVSLTVSGAVGKHTASKIRFFSIVYQII